MATKKIDELEKMNTKYKVAQQIIEYLEKRMDELSIQISDLYEENEELKEQIARLSKQEKIKKNYHVQKKKKRNKIKFNDCANRINSTQSDKNC